MSGVGLVDHVLIHLLLELDESGGAIPLDEAEPDFDQHPIRSGSLTASSSAATKLDDAWCNRPACNDDLADRDR